MKKIIPILFMIFLVYFYVNKEEVVIPNDAIRFRIIANSDDIKDQEVKIQIKNSVKEKMNKLMIDARNSSEAKKIIEQNMPQIEEIVSSYTDDYTISFGMNYFPEKDYHGITYQSGEYESLVITLGTGTGKNWWCVMFPPLCLLEAKNENTEDIEYRFYVKELLEKYSS